jgi:predicted membrane protein
MDSIQQDSATGQDQQQPPKNRKNLIAGLILLAVGAVLLLNTLGVNLPYWLISWQVGLIVIGLALGFASRFRDFTWLIVTGVGTFFLISKLLPDIQVYRFILPVAFIVVGLIVLYGARGNWFSGKRNKEDKEFGLVTDDNAIDSEDQVLELIAAFGGINKTVYNKNFRGGEIVTIFGGGEVNLLHADFNGTITIEVVHLFGGVKLKVPSHWEVTTAAAVAIFGGIDDKRNTSIPTDPNKKLIIRGTIIFGGLDIKSY